MQTVDPLSTDGRALVTIEPAWRLRWLTPARCRMILAAVLLLDVVGHVHYLNDKCPIACLAKCATMTT